MKHIMTILFFTAGVSYAQVTYTYDEGATFQFENNTSAQVLRVSSSSGNKISGSEFLNEEWTQATIFDLNKKKKVKLLARFNAYTKEIEVLKEKEIISLSPVDGVSVFLDNKTFVPFKSGSGKKTIFAEELVSGKIRIYKAYDVKIIKAASDATLLNIDNEDKLVIVDKLYYQKENGAILTLPGKKKSLSAILNDKTLKFIKKDKLSLKKESDLVKIFEFNNAESED